MSRVWPVNTFHLLARQRSAVASRGRIYSFYAYPSRNWSLQMASLNQTEPEGQAPTGIVRQIIHLIYYPRTVTLRSRKWFMNNSRNDTRNGAKTLLAAKSNAMYWTVVKSRYAHWIVTFLPQPWCCERNTTGCCRCDHCRPSLKKRPENRRECQVSGKNRNAKECGPGGRGIENPRSVPRQSVLASGRG